MGRAHLPTSIDPISNTSIEFSVCIPLKMSGPCMHGHGHWQDCPTCAPPAARNRIFSYAPTSGTPATAVHTSCSGRTLSSHLNDILASPDANDLHFFLAHNQGVAQDLESLTLLQDVAHGEGYPSSTTSTALSFLQENDPSLRAAPAAVSFPPSPRAEVERILTAELYSFAHNTAGLKHYLNKCKEDLSQFPESELAFVLSQYSGDSNLGPQARHLLADLGKSCQAGQTLSVALDKSFTPTWHADRHGLLDSQLEEDSSHSRHHRHGQSHRD